MHQLFFRQKSRNHKRLSTRHPKRRLITEALESRRLLAGPHAPAAGEIGSEAIRFDEARLVGFASGVADFSPGANVDEAFQTPLNALGPATELADSTVSLGAGGQITLTFDHPIRDGLGDDLVVFENSFSDTFLELAFVEVSSDGINFFRFANDSLTPEPVGSFGSVDPTEVDGLAGKYRRGFGVGFDLSTLPTDVNLDTNAITQVRIVDILGDGSTTDSSGNPIFDPTPGSGSAGFDLDAVGVIHELTTLTTVVDFEDRGAELAPSSFFNGPTENAVEVIGGFGDVNDLGTFTSGPLSFNNSVSREFGSFNNFAVSNVVDTTTPGFENQFASFVGGGAEGSDTYAIAFVTPDTILGPPTITLSAEDSRQFESIQITNTTFTALSVLNGDQFARQFGGDSGDEPDTLVLTITGRDVEGQSTGTIDFFLADYRFEDNSLDFVVDEYTTVDLSSLGDARSLEFAIDSTDVGPFGINTPRYFALDDIVLTQSVLPIELADPSVPEDAGENATVLRVNRFDGDTSEPLAVDLFTDAPTDTITIADSVTIPVGERFIDVPIGVIDNDSFVNNPPVTLTARADGFAESSVALNIINDEVELSIDSEDSFSESQSGPIVTFELLGRQLASESFLNRPVSPNDQFVSESVELSNQFNAEFNSFSGFAISNVTDNQTAGFTNLFASFTGAGADGSDTYAIGNAFPGGFVPTIRRDPSTTSGFTSIDVANTTFAALSIRDGDQFARQFGGPSGNDPDFFTLTIEGVDEQDISVGSVDVDLADFRFDDNTQDFILDTFRRVDLSTIATAIELQFSLDSSDVGDFGLNTPVFFAIDNVQLAGIDQPPTITISRSSQDLSEDLIVSLNTSDSSEARLPELVTIATGQSSVEVPLSIFPDRLVDGPQNVTLSASADGFNPSEHVIVINDEDLPTLTLDIGRSGIVSENSGAITATVHRNTVDTSEPLSVSIATNAEGQVIEIPTDVIIPSDQRGVNFTFSPIDNEDLDDDRVVEISAAEPSFAGATSTLTITDEDILIPALSIELSSQELNESDAATVIGFEDIGATIGEESFDNGQGRNGLFTSGPVELTNEFNPMFGSFSGFAISNSTDNVTPGFTNLFGAFPGSGGNSSQTFAVASAFPGSFVPEIILTDPNRSFESIEVTNTTFAALSIRDGDDFARQFGGDSGDEPDFFLLTIEGLDAEGDSVGSVEVPLADFRFDDNTQDFILDTFQNVDLRSLPDASRLQFSLQSSDVGDFGINTPAFFAIDNLRLSDLNPSGENTTPRNTITATVSRPTTDTAEPLVVELINGDTTEISLPNTVTIPAGVSSIDFIIEAVDDLLFDEDVLATVTVAADGFRSSSQSVSILDNDAQTLTLSANLDSISEAPETPGETQEIEVVVHRNDANPTNPLVVDLVSSGSDLALPDSVTIPGGSNATTLSVEIVNNDVADGDRIATILGSTTPSVAVANELTITITDDELANLVVIETDDRSEVTELDLDDSFTVQLAARPLTEVVVDVSLENEQVIIDDDQLVFTPENFDQPQTVLIQAVPDLLLEPVQDVTVLLTASSDSVFEGQQAEVSVQVTDQQSTLLQIAETDDLLVVSDAERDVPIVQSGLSEGIEVVTSNENQSLVIEPLNRVQGPVLIDLAGGDDAVQLRTARFTILDGGSGVDSLVVRIDEDTDLVGLIDQRVFGFESIVISGTADSAARIFVNAERLDRLADPLGQVQLDVEPSANLVFEGAFQAADPIFEDGQFVQVVQAGQTELRLRSELIHQNVMDRFDVDRSSEVTALDALQIINELQRSGAGELAPIESLDDFGGAFFDVSGDGNLSAVDALQVINEITRRQFDAEGEFIAGSTFADPLATDAAINSLFQTAPTSSFQRDGDEEEHGNETSGVGLLF